MNHDAIRKRLATLGEFFAPGGKVVSVELPDTTWPPWASFSRLAARLFPSSCRTARGRP